MCYHFPDTCVVAEEGGKVVGFLAAYRSPLAADAVFVWQLCVGWESRDAEIASLMLTDLLNRDVNHGVRYLEATISPSESAQQVAIRGLARRFGAVCEERHLFMPHLFAEEDHREECLYRVGPFEVGIAMVHGEGRDG
ncbi:MAG: GNAT family N-acetyltransferase [bacterium]